MTAKTVVIAFLARAGSGKTTAAQYLIENHGAVRVSFAGPLKELARGLMDFNDEQLYGSLKETIDERYGMTPRTFLQRLGNQARQIIGENVWIDAAMNTIKENEGRLIVIDDCRYLNEAEAISALYLDGDGKTEGHVIKIVSLDRTSVADPHHPSEAGVDLVPEVLLFATLVNDQHKGLESFKEMVQEVVIDALGVFPGRLRD